MCVFLNLFSCPEGEMFDENGVCVPITDCSIPRCVWGDCVLVPDPDNPGELIWRCNCYEGWTGVHCNETDPVFVSTMATVSTGWISSVTAALLLLLSKYYLANFRLGSIGDCSA